MSLSDFGRSLISKGVEIELPAACNQRCSWCHVRRVAAGKPLERAQWLSIITYLGAHGCQGVDFAGKEPTLNSDLLSFIKAAADAGIPNISVATNGRLGADPEFFGVMVRFNVKLRVSLHAHEAELHDVITDCPGSFTAAVAFIKEAVRRGLTVDGGVTIDDRNWKVFWKTAALLDSLGVATISGTPAQEIGDGPPNPELHTIASNFKESCSTCKGHPAITADGKLLPCIIARTMVLGDLTSEKLSDILTVERFEPKLKLIRELARNAIVPAPPEPEECEAVC